MGSESPSASPEEAGTVLLVEAPGLPARFEAALSARRITAAQLAERTNVSKNTLTGWRKARPCVRVDRVTRVARELGVSLTELLGPIEDPFAPEASVGSAREIGNPVPAGPELTHLAAAIPDLLEVLKQAEGFAALGADVGRLVEILTAFSSRTPISRASR